MPLFLARLSGASVTATALRLENLETLIRGVFAPQRFLALLQHFIVFKEDPDSGATRMIIAGYHQFHAVNAAEEETRREASRSHGRERLRFRLSTFMLTAVNHALATTVPNDDPADLPFVGITERFVREPGKFLDQASHGSHIGLGVRSAEAV